MGLTYENVTCEGFIIIAEVNKRPLALFQFSKNMHVSNIVLKRTCTSAQKNKIKQKY